MIRRSTRGAATTATTRSRCSRGSARPGPVHEVTPARRAARRGSSPATPRPGPRSTTRGCPRTCTPRSPATAPWSPRACPAPRSPGTCSAVDPPDHTRLRALATAAFSRPRVAALRPRIQAIVDDLLDELHRRGDDRRRPGRGLRLPPAVHGDQRAARHPRTRPGRARRPGSPRCWPPPRRPNRRPSAVAASANIVGYLTELLDRKRVEPGEDLVTDLVRAGDERDALNQQEMLSTIFQLIVAGHDTTTSLIGNGDGRAAAPPRPARRAGRRPRASCRAAIEEMLRWDAPVPHSTFRYTTQDVPLGDVVIPAHAQVIISLAAANRDPHRYRRTPKPSTSPAPTAATWPSATASTTASAPGWPGWRA